MINAQSVLSNTVAPMYKSNARYELKPKTIRELAEGFDEDVETGKVVAFGGKLDVRPAFQREFIYGPKERQDVIETIKNNAPLGEMYWFKTTHGFELVEGQQRTISICQFVKGDFAVNWDNNLMKFSSLPKDVKERILNYQLQVYEVIGNESDKLHWFRVINHPKKTLTPQELRNSAYTGSWLSAAKKDFSNPKGFAANKDGKYFPLTGGDAKRQDILEIALTWIAGEDDDAIEQYMADHQHDEDASELVDYFNKVTDWVYSIIGDDDNPSRIQLGKKWGALYRKYHDTFNVNREEIDAMIDKLCRDDEVNEKPKGFYPFIISNDIRNLFQRQFSKAMREKKYREQGGVCPMCGKHFTIKGMEADHIKPWRDGGKTVYENLQMLCQECNNRKSSGIC